MHRQRQVDRERLASYGIPTQLIDEFDSMAKRGAFDEEAPDELLAKTLDACLSSLEREPVSPFVFSFEPFGVIHFHRHDRLDLMAATVGAQSKLMRRSLETCSAAPVRVEAVREPKTYALSECDILRELYRSDPCDIRWTSARLAEACGFGQNIMVMEPYGVFAVDGSTGKRDLPDEPAEVCGRLGRLQTVTVRRNGAFEPEFAGYFSSPEGVRQAIAHTFAAHNW